MKIDNFKKIKNDINNGIENNQKKLQFYINIRLILILLIILFSIAFISNKKYPLLSIPAIILIASIILTIIISKYQKIDKKLNYKKEVVNAYINRFNNKYKSDNNTGLEYAKKEYFESDLDIFGKNSLYSYINFARTTYGKKYVADSLDASLRDKDEIIVRQNSIKSLSKNLVDVINVASSSFEYEKLNQNITMKDIETGLDSLNNVYKPNLFKVILSSLYIVGLITIIVLSSIKMIPVYSPFLLMSFGFLLCMFINPEAHLLANDMSNAKHVLYGYNELIDEINKLKSNDTLVKSLKDKVSNLKSKSVISFNIISSLSESRNNILFQFIFNGLFMLDNFVILSYYIWQKNNKNIIKEALESIGKIEELVSLATIDLVKEDSIYPIISNEFKFDNIRHPLIIENNCVPNSFTFIKRNVITGSNMSGKTTFMRSIGTNYILFLAGSAVCATSFEAPILKLFTSMKVVDDVNNNISTFYGEILRIKAICDYTKENKPMLVLVDEIFKGTNTKDRIIGATAAIDKLNRDDIYSIITTHDPDLCAIDGVNNYHFLEHYVDDKIQFDYKIHDGISNTRNAIYLLKLAGIVE